jgi:hypothetical protein
MVITDDWIAKNGTGANSWTRKQLDLIRVSWPPKTGWRRWAVGQEIDDAAAREFERIGRERRTKLAQKSVTNDLEW